MKHEELRKPDPWNRMRREGPAVDPDTIFTPRLMINRTVKYWEREIADAQRAMNNSIRIRKKYIQLCRRFIRKVKAMR